MNLLSYFKSDVIEFFCDERYFNVAPPPEPAIKNIPEWFKLIPPRSKKTRDSHGKLAMNAKKCLPMIDAMSLGFTITLPIDQQINSNSDNTIVKIGPTSTIFDRAAEYHAVEQVGGRSELFKGDPIKFINPWVIKTAPGWSTLFIPPINSGENRFICLGGLVDTDVYPKQVNFPARWLMPNYDGVLSAGTPLVTAIPIRRRDLNPSYNIREMNDNDRKKIDLIQKNQHARDHYYTKELRQR